MSGGFGGGGGDSACVQVPTDYIGRIIGKRGAKIIEIRENSGAKLDFAKDEQSDSGTPLYITGSADSVSSAKAMVEQILANDFSSGGGGGGGYSGGGGGGFGGGGGGFGGGARRGGGGGGACYKCGEEGHFSRECPQGGGGGGGYGGGGGRGGGGGGGRACYNCGQEGHMSRECPSGGGGGGGGRGGW